MAINISKQISSMKNTIITAFMNDSNVVSVIDNPNIVDPQDLEYENIFPMWRVDTTELEKRTVLCIKVSATASKRSDVVQRFYVDVLIFTSQELQKVPRTSVARNCTRIDYLAQCVEDILNRSTEIGLGEAHLVTNDEDSIDSRHPARMMRFEVLGFSSNYVYP